MHIPDGFVSGPINLTGAIAAASALGLSSWRTSREIQEQPHTVPLLATTGAFVFAAQMLNFPIGGGTSGHFLGAAAVAALLGPWRACLVMSLVLTIQSLAFSDGGLTALGTNMFNMGVVGVFGAYLIMRVLRAVLPMGRGGYVLSAAVASWVSVVLASTACALELAMSGTSPLFVVLPAMVGTHAIIAMGESLITVALLSAVVAARPDVLPEWARVGEPAHQNAGRRSGWVFAVAGLLISLALAALISPLASEFPDGLEKVAQEQGFIEQAEQEQIWKASPLPDYTVPAVEADDVSTGLAGLLGTMGIFAVGFCVVKLLGMRSVKQES